MQIILREKTYKKRDKKWLHKVNFMMTLDDYDNLKKTAQCEGQQVASFVRIAISNELHRLEIEKEKINRGT